MNNIVDALVTTLHRSRTILKEISDEHLTNTSIPPYYSCIGTHIRHVLDFYSCIDKGLTEGKVDLTVRNRNAQMETNCSLALQEVEQVLMKLESWRNLNPNKKIWVSDDLGLGKQEIEYTLAALAAQANSHTIHHYALINYMLDRLGVRIDDTNFGYNPSTPKPGTINLAG